MRIFICYLIEFNPLLKFFWNIHVGENRFNWTPSIPALQSMQVSDLYIICQAVHERHQRTTDVACKFTINIFDCNIVIVVIYLRSKNRTGELIPLPYDDVPHQCKQNQLSYWLWLFDYQFFKLGNFQLSTDIS